MREQLTESDVKKIEEEIQHRKHVLRKEAIEAVKEAGCEKKCAGSSQRGTCTWRPQ